MAVSTGLKLYKPPVISLPAARKATALSRATAEPIAAHSAAQRLLIAKPISINMPASHEFIRKTCAMPFNQYSIRCSGGIVFNEVICVGRVGSVRCSTGIPCIARAANRKIQVQNTNGKVKEFTFQGAITLFIPDRTQVVIAAQIISAIHIPVVVPRNVGKAQPTNMPLKPQRPCWPSSRGRRSM